MGSDRYRILALLLAALAAGPACQSRRAASSSPPADPGYVDAAACAACHAEIAKTYRDTGMGRSFYRLRPETRVEDFQNRNRLYHRPSDLHYTMLEREGRFYFRRHQTGFGGREANVVAKQIDYVIGSGNHARSYLHRNAEGRLIEMPVSWYSERGGYWAMSPGFDHAAQQDFRRDILHDCMFCHNGYPPPGSPAQQPDSDAVFGDQLPEGIDCQRCHGPGRRHLEAAGSGSATPEAIRAAIVNPARLGRDRQLEVCLQCHLETTSRPLPHQIRRHGHAPFAYRPG